MNVIGKIFVFAVFVMSLVFMSFAVAIYSSHINWEQEVNRKPEDVRGAQQPGLKYQKEQWEKERQTLDKEIEVLARKVAESESSRDQMIAKLQSALELKSGELVDLRKSKEEREKTQREAIEKLEDAQVNLKKAAEEVDALRKQVQAQQVAVDGKVTDASKLSGELNAALAQLAIVTERKAELEQQLVRARELLRQNGLNPQSDPAGTAVTDGTVSEVAGNSIQVDIGSDQGIRMGSELDLFRGGEYIGKAQVAKVNRNSALATLKPEFSRGIVQPGDRATTRLRK
jgi:cell shape-determining protein MreC